MVERKGAHSVVSHLILFVGAAMVILPIYIAMVAASHPAEELIRATPLWFGPYLWDNLSSIMSKGFQAAGGAPVWRMMLNSFIMSMGIAVGKIAVSLIAAYAIVYFRMPGRGLFFFLILITLMLPVEVRIVPTFEVATNLGLIDSYTGLIMPLVASATATFLYRQFFLTIPEELLEAARIDGAGPWRFFKDVAWPLSRTNTAALFVVTFITGWNQYLWPLLVTNKESMYTVVMAIQRMVNVPDAPVEWNLVMCTALLGMLPPLVVVLGMQRLFIKGLIEQEK